MKAKFQGELYQLVFTDHAESRMKSRGISIQEVVAILETGKVKAKEKPLS